MELSPEERRSIYEEEKARLESEKELAEGKRVKYTIYLGDELKYEMQVI